MFLPVVIEQFLLIASSGSVYQQMWCTSWHSRHEWQL